MNFFFCFISAAFAQLYTTNCEGEKFRLDLRSGILRILRNSSDIVGRQCGLANLEFDNSSAVDVCQQDGVDVLVVRVTSGHSYFHFVMHELQRTVLTPKRSPIVLGSHWKYNNERQKEWLALFGISGFSPLLRPPPKIGKVAVAVSVEGGCDASGALLMQKALSSRVDLGSIPFNSSLSQIIWFDRPVGVRYVNHVERNRVLDFLRPAFAKTFGLRETSIDVVIHNALVSLNDTMQLLNAAQHVLLVGPHGAGFTNMLLRLVQPPLLVLEIHPRTYHETGLIYQGLFAQMSEVLGFPHTVIVTAGGAAQSSEEMHVENAALLAALGNLRRQVKDKKYCTTSTQ